MQIKDAMVFAFPPPPIFELGTSSGFDFYLKDLRGQGHDALTAARNQFLGMASQNKLMQNVRPNGQEDTPELRVDVDIAKAGALGLDIGEVNETLALAWGGRYVDDFIDRGRVKRVILQADAPSHGAAGLRPRYVRNREGRWCRSPPSHLALAAELAASRGATTARGDADRRRGGAGVSSGDA